MYSDGDDGWEILEHITQQDSNQQNDEEEEYEIIHNDPPSKTRISAVYAQYALCLAYIRTFSLDRHKLHRFSEYRNTFGSLKLPSIPLNAFFLKIHTMQILSTVSNWFNYMRTCYTVVEKYWDIIHVLLGSLVGLLFVYSITTTYDGVVLEYPNGDVYTGETVFSIPDMGMVAHGQGVLKYARNEAISRDWPDDRAGCSYMGEFDQGLLTGKGMLKCSQNVVDDGNGLEIALVDEYRGSFKNGVKHGMGELHKVSGDIWKGEWLRGTLNHAKILYLGGAQYEGDVSEKFGRHGKGVMDHTSGVVYSGYWKYDREHGFGSLEEKSGSSYVGYWVAGKQHGHGKQVAVTWGEYSGNWALGKYEGRGRIDFHTGESYIGTWKGGKKDGHGETLWPNGDKYSGQYRQDKRHGHGKYTWMDGRTFNGEWTDNKYYDCSLFNVNCEWK